jgi:putative hemolysin
MFKRKEDTVEEEILSMVEEGHEQGVIKEDEAEMISNILDFNDKKVRDIMTSRNRIFAVEKTKRVGECLQECLQSGYSRYPVYEEDIDNIIGVLHLKDMVKAYLKSNAIAVSSIIDSPMFVHPTYDISKLLKKMQKEKTHMAIVVDEYGQTDGLVTLEDIIEEIVGNIQDEHDNEEKEARRTLDDGYIVDGLISLNDLEDLYDDLEFPESDIETLNGFMLYKYGHLPEDDQQNIKIDYGGYTFETLEIKDRIIQSVKIKKTEE